MRKYFESIIYLLYGFIITLLLGYCVLAVGVYSTGVRENEAKKTATVDYMKISDTVSHTAIDYRTIEKFYNYARTQASSASINLFADDKRYYTEQYIYQLSNHLLGSGCTVCKPEVTINDLETRIWRKEKIPVYGAESDYISPISITKDETVSDTAYSYILNCIKSMPQALIYRMVDDGWTVKVISGVIESTEAENVDVIGRANFEDKTITIKSSSKRTIYHEVGHVLASYADKDLTKSGLYEYKTDGELEYLYCHSADGSPYIYMNPGEQIAESFYDYCIYPKEMKCMAPTLYRIFETYSK